MNNFVRYVAQYPTIAPQIVFRRLKYMGTFFLIGIVGIVAALILIDRDVSMSEPARLLTAFGFVAGAVVVVATVFAAGLLLWGGFISQYVANLESQSEIAELCDLQDTLDRIRAVMSREPVSKEEIRRLLEERRAASRG